MEFPFPFPPYDIQKELMEKIYQSLDEGKLAVLESPTGTGKSLSIICSALTWLHRFTNNQKEALEAQLRTEEDALKKCDAAEDWFAAASVRHKHLDALIEIKRKLSALQRHAGRIEAIKERRKQLKLIVDGRYKVNNKENFNSDFSVRQSRESDLQFYEDLILADDPLETTDEGSVEDTEEDEQPDVKIFYCSRTHSQLSQFIGELQKTVYGGSQTRVVALAARPNLCINEEVSRLKSPSLINDRCLELQNYKPKDNKNGDEKTRKRGRASNCCPYYNSAAIRALADEILCEVTDLEDLVKEGRRRQACPYYAARTALTDAQLVVVPYNNVLQTGTREACGISLRGNCLIVDEAHNLLSTLAGVQEQTISFSQLVASRRLLEAYLQRYQCRLSPRNLLYLNQLIFCLKAFQHVLSPESSAKSKLVFENSGGELDVLVTVPQFLASCRVDNINFNTLLQYLDASHLAHKLHGFAQVFPVMVSQNPDQKAKANSENASSSSALSAWLAQATNSRTTLEKLKENSDSKKSQEEPSDPTFAGRTEPTFGNPFLQAVEFFRRLVSLNDSGRIMVHRKDLSTSSSKGTETDCSGPSGSFIKYLVLDPASHFHKVVQECRAVLLAGGTMKPFQEFTQQLFLAAGAQPPRLVEHSCGHVVPKENILPLAVSYGPTQVTLDLTHLNRTNISMAQEIGRCLLNLCRCVAGGIVVFLPSYQYAKFLLATLRTDGTLASITNFKKVLEEPREAAAVNAVLQQYSSAILKTSGASGRVGGAMLFCVVGGKMSEGINFSDDLGRCVVMVGLPYPNTKSTELQERMKHLDSIQPREAAGGQESAGAAYYHNLCFRAVNQSIGRAIRHRRDYACIVLLDHRYARASTVSSLPDWISENIVRPDKFGQCISAVAQFFARHRDNPQR